MVFRTEQFTLKCLYVIFKVHHKYKIWLKSKPG